MVRYEDNRRVVARAITFIDNSVLLIERYKYEKNMLMHYFTVPGGGVEYNEDYQDAAIRETKEETCCNITIIKYLMIEDYPHGRCYWFYGEYLSGTPTLGGEEKERNNPKNSYKVVLIDIRDIDKITILGVGKELIKKCYHMYYQIN